MVTITSLKPIFRIDLDKILRMILSVIGTVFWSAGWFAAKLVKSLWIALYWSATAVKVGWKEGLTSGPAR